jgi:hypothetical protein
MNYKIKKVSIFLTNRVQHNASISFLGSEIEDAFSENGLFVIQKESIDVMYPLGVIDRIEIEKEV